MTAPPHTEKGIFSCELRYVRGPSTYPLIGLITVANLDRRMKYVDSRAAPAAQFEPNGRFMTVIGVWLLKVENSKNRR